MTTNRGGWFVWALAAALVAVGCDEVEGGRQPLTVAASGSSVVAQRPADADPGSYAAMCHHYCETLQQTNVYFCLSQGRGDLASCAAAVTDLTAECDQLRCAPKLVEPQLCLTQCDSLGALYGPYCAGMAPAADTACPAPPQAHDDECRAGCADAPS